MVHWSERTDSRREKDPARDREIALKHMMRAYKQAKKVADSPAAKSELSEPQPGKSSGKPANQSSK